MEHPLIPTAPAVQARPVDAPGVAADDAYARYRTVGTALALLVIAASTIEFARNAVQPGDRDFISFWGAARLALAGTPAAAYDLDTLHAVQSAAAQFGAGKMPFPYPPLFLALVMPFALLPFPAAMAAWSAAGFLGYFAVVRRLFPGSGWLAAAFPPVFASAAIGQTGFLTAACFAGGLLLLRSRPFVAGLLLGCLVLKPQLGLFLPIALLAGRQWRAIAGAAVSSIGLLALGALLFGVESTQAWLAQMPLYVAIGRDGLVGWEKLASVYSAARHAGLAEAPAFAIHGMVAAAAGCAVWSAWRSDGDPRWKAAVLAAATLLASPYLFLYDTLLLVIAFLWLARTQTDSRLVAALWLLPIVSIAQIGGAPGAPNTMTVLPLSLLLLLFQPQARAVRRQASDKAPALV